MKSIGKKMLAWVLSVLLIAGCCLVAGVPKDMVKAEPNSSVTDSGACGNNLTWVLENDGTLTISGKGAMENYLEEHREDTSNGYRLYYSFSPWDSYKSQIESVVIEEGVTSIGSHAFSSCSSLTEITLPDSITNIGGYAFFGCSNLAEIAIPDGVISIGEGAFYKCNNLTGISIPDNIVSINSLAFDDTGYYDQESNWKDDVLYLGNYLIAADNTLSGSYSIRPGTKVIAGAAFSGCSSLTAITIPNSVISIEEGAFSNCSNLTEISIPDSVTNIGNSAFSWCSNLTAIIVPDSVISIGSKAFYTCTSLTEIIIPDSIINIGSSAFDGTGYYNQESNWQDDVLYLGNYLIAAKTVLSGSYSVRPGTKVIAGDVFSFCTGLTEVIIPNSVISIGNEAFRGCTGLTEVTIPNSVISIGNEAFRDCTDLTKVTVPDSITSIGDQVFSCCTSLTEIAIPDSVTDIGWGVFYNCSGLTEIIIPDGITNIEDYAFYICTSLMGITIPDSVTSIGTYAFGYYYDNDNRENVLQDGFTVYGYQGTAAETYANENGIPFVALDQPNLPFADIQDPDTYYYDAVQYVFQNGLMTGMNATTFGPSQTLSRAQFAVILYRMAGSPNVAGMANPFADNQQASFYRDAVIWCNNAGIITGYFNADGSFTGRFGPSDLITREQLATMLYRYANYAGMDTSASISLDDFGDSNRVSSFAADALQWAAAEGIVSGRQTTPPTIAPQDNASRADTAVMLQRFLA